MPGPRRPAWGGPGPVAEYLEAMTEVSPGDEPVLLPPLVTVVARRAAAENCATVSLRCLTS